MCVCVCVCVSCSVVSDSLWPHGLELTRLLCPWDIPVKNIGVGNHSLLLGIFLTQGSKLGPPHCKQILYHFSHHGSPPCIVTSVSESVNDQWSHKPQLVVVLEEVIERADLWVGPGQSEAPPPVHVLGIYILPPSHCSKWELFQGSSLEGVRWCCDHLDGKDDWTQIRHLGLDPGGQVWWSCGCPRRAS